MSKLGEIIDIKHNLEQTRKAYTPAHKIMVPSAYKESCKHKQQPQGFLQQFWEKAPGQNWEKIIDLMSKLGEIIDIKHNLEQNLS